MFKIVKNPGNGSLNNLNDPVLNVLKGKVSCKCSPVRKIFLKKKSVLAELVKSTLLL